MNEFSGAALIESAALKPSIPYDRNSHLFFVNRDLQTGAASLSLEDGLKHTHFQINNDVPTLLAMLQRSVGGDSVREDSGLTLSAVHNGTDDFDLDLSSLTTEDVRYIVSDLLATDAMDETAQQPTENKYIFSECTAGYITSGTTKRHQLARKLTGMDSKEPAIRRGAVWQGIEKRSNQAQNAGYELRRIVEEMFWAQQDPVLYRSHIEAAKMVAPGEPVAFAAKLGSTDVILSARPDGRINVEYPEKSLQAGHVSLGIPGGDIDISTSSTLKGNECTLRAFELTDFMQYGKTAKQISDNGAELTEMHEKLQSENRLVTAGDFPLVYDLTSIMGTRPLNIRLAIPDGWAQNGLRRDGQPTTRIYQEPRLIRIGMGQGHAGVREGSITLNDLSPRGVESARVSINYEVSAIHGRVICNNSDVPETIPLFP